MNKVFISSSTSSSFLRMIERGDNFMMRMRVDMRAVGVDFLKSFRRPYFTLLTVFITVLFKVKARARLDRQIVD